MSVVSRGTLRTVSDATKTQTVQVELNGDETTFAIEHLQPFGFSSVPVTGADALHLSVGANRANGIVVAINDSRYRPTGNSEGTVCLHTQNAVLVRCLPNGDVEIGEAPTQYAARADKVAAEINAVIAKLNALVAAYAVHTHVVVVDAESSTGFGTEATLSTATAASVTTAAKNACEKVKAK